MTGIGLAAIVYIRTEAGNDMQKTTLKFESLETMATFSRVLNTGFVMNTIKFCLIGPFTDFEVGIALEQYGGRVVETDEKVYGYI
jgi:hypothetical protein